MSNPIHIVQLLVLSEEESVRELSPALWATLLEIERLYNRDQPRATFERQFVSRHAPPTSVVASTLRTVARFFGKDVDSAVALLSEHGRHDYPLESERSIQGRFTNTIDQVKLWSTARGLLGKDRDNAYLMVVTDREITPPKGFRYIIWDGIGRDGVVSIPPTDPKYWRQQDPFRVATIKHRVRTACLSMAGEWLGYERCENPSCFLFQDVDSVTVLDSMLEFGPEHSVPRLTSFGFEFAGREPGTLQTPVTSPTPAWSK